MMSHHHKCGNLRWSWTAMGVCTTDIRPISLTPNVSKILKSFIGNIILEHVKERKDPNQYGALKGLSTTHALVDLLHNVHEFIHNGTMPGFASSIIPRRSI